MTNINISNHAETTIVTVEEYIRRGMKKINLITEDDMDECDEIFNPFECPDSVCFLGLFTRLMCFDSGWFSDKQKDDDGKYNIGVLIRENSLDKLIIPHRLPYCEVIHFYDVFVATTYNISEEHHRVGEWLINSYLGNIKDELLYERDINYWTSKKNVANMTVNYGDVIKTYKVKDYIEFKNDEGQEKFINFPLVAFLSELYTVTPYQMEFINSGKYNIKEGLMPDFSYYDPILNELGISKEQVTGPINYTPDSFSQTSMIADPQFVGLSAGLINHAYFCARPFKLEIDTEPTKEDRRQIKIEYKYSLKSQDNPSPSTISAD
jgi:hypothetical protein